MASFYEGFQPASEPVPFRDQLTGSSFNPRQQEFREAIRRLEDPLQLLMIDIIRRMPEIERAYSTDRYGPSLLGKIEYHLCFNDPSLNSDQYPEDYSKALSLFKNFRLSAEEMRDVGRSIFVGEFDDYRREIQFGSEPPHPNIENE